MLKECGCKQGSFYVRLKHHSQHVLLEPEEMQKSRAHCYCIGGFLFLSLDILSSVFFTHLPVCQDAVCHIAVTSRF